MCRNKCECRQCVTCGVPVEQKPGRGRAKLYCDACRSRMYREAPAAPALHECVECGRRWVKQASAGRKPKFCSMQCRHKWRHRQRSASVQCMRCHITFVSSTGRARYCRACDRWRPSAGQSVPCDVCDALFYRRPSSTRKHCNVECRRASVRKSFTCKTCDRAFSRRKYRKSDTRQYCCIQCYWDAHGMTGRTTARLNGNWVGNARRRCRKAGVPYDPSVTVAKVAERDGYECQICRRECNRTWLVGRHSRKPHPLNRTVDHIVPLAAGVHGHEWHNVQCACLSCNMKKGAKRRQAQLRLL